VLGMLGEVRLERRRHHGRHGAAPRPGQPPPLEALGEDARLHLYSKCRQSKYGAPRAARARVDLASTTHTHTHTRARACLLEGCEEVGLLGGAGEDEQHVVGPVGLAVVARHLRVGEAVQVGHLAACLRRVAAVRVEQLEHRAVDKRARCVLPCLRRASKQESEGVAGSR